jgi:hypothetical protein
MNSFDTGISIRIRKLSLPGFLLCRSLCLSLMPFFKEVPMNVATLKDALLFAMDKEKKANELYLLFRGKVKDDAARALLQELADQEMGHWKMIREALDSGSVEGIGAKAKGRDIQVSDYMVEIELTPTAARRTSWWPPCRWRRRPWNSTRGSSIDTAARTSRPSSPGWPARRCGTRRSWKRSTRSTSRSGCESRVSGIGYRVL